MQSSKGQQNKNHAVTFCNCKMPGNTNFTKGSAKIMLAHSKRREEKYSEKSYRACPKGTAVQIFLFNSGTIALKKVHPGHVDLSH